MIYCEHCGLEIVWNEQWVDWMVVPEQFNGDICFAVDFYGFKHMNHEPEHESKRVKRILEMYDL